MSLLKSMFARTSVATTAEPTPTAAPVGAATNGLTRGGSFNDFSLGATLDAGAQPLLPPGRPCAGGRARSAGARDSARCAFALRPVRADEGYNGYDPRLSAERQRNEMETRAVVTEAVHGVKPGAAVGAGMHSDPWRATFHPGKNFSMPRGNETYDTVQTGSPSTWEQILRAEHAQNRRLSFSALDANNDGFIDSTELRSKFGESVAASLIREADITGDGKIAVHEWERVMSRVRGVNPK